jgi:hypothetical protein
VFYNPRPAAKAIQSYASGWLHTTQRTGAPDIAGLGFNVGGEPALVLPEAYKLAQIVQQNTYKGTRQTASGGTQCSKKGQGLYIYYLLSQLTYLPV